jgi:flagellar motility protein MotE (MotC chaperone)
MCSVALCFPAIAEASANDNSKAAQPTQPHAGMTSGKRLPLAEAYCKAILDNVREARYKQQLEKLRALSTEIDGKLQTLNATAMQVETWLKERRSFVDRASTRLVEIFSSMRPDAASGQIARLDDTTASAIMMKLEPRAAASIMGEMPVQRAARLAAIIAGAANLKQSRSN